MTSYTLTYFNAKGLAEVSRLMFAEAEVKYDDVRIEREKWPEMKQSTPLGQLPILKVDGHVIPQSKAFSRYLAREFGFYGSTNLEASSVDVVLETQDDMLQGLRTFMVEQNEEEKAKKRDAFYSAEGSGPVNMHRLAKLLGDNDYFVGNKISLADFSMLICTDWYLRGDSSALDDFPTLTAFRNRILTLPNIAKWIAERPVTDF